MKSLQLLLTICTIFVCYEQFILSVFVKSSFSSNLPINHHYAPHFNVSLQLCPPIPSSFIHTHVGALITGKSNFDVARILLERGLESIEGVVFLDEDDRQMILIREGWRVMKVAQCGLLLEKRFTFYDQV